MVNNFTKKNYLIHYGVKGMKWKKRKAYNSNDEINTNSESNRRTREKNIVQGKGYIAKGKAITSNNPISGKTYVSSINKDSKKYRLAQRAYERRMLGSIATPRITNSKKRATKYMITV